jgi:hypothetical protein
VTRWKSYSKELARTCLNWKLTETPRALSEQKAEEAKLIKARQEGFQTALELLSGESSAGNPASGEDRELTLIAAAAVSGHPISRKHVGEACAGRSAN